MQRLALAPSPSTAGVAQAARAYFVARAGYVSSHKIKIPPSLKGGRLQKYDRTDNESMAVTMMQKAANVTKQQQDWDNLDVGVSMCCF